MTSSAPPATRPRDVAAATAGRVVAGGARGAWYWPGMVALVAAYAGVAIGLYGHADPNLWGGVAALVVGVAWYSSPLRAWEAGRRARAPRRQRGPGSSSLARRRSGS